MARVLLLTGGSPHAHDFMTTGAALAGVAARAGHDVTTAAHPDEAAAVIAGTRFDAIVVAGLWWRMQGEAYDAWRPAWAYETASSTSDALASFVHRGGGLLALHTATICFDDWPAWREVVGARWDWTTSWHPPLGPVTARVVASWHPAMTAVPGDLVLVDEVYGDLDVHDDVEVLAVARRALDDAEQPVVWAHAYGAGRVVYDGFGHDASSITTPDHTALVTAALSWVTKAA